MQDQHGHGKYKYLDFGINKGSVSGDTEPEFWCFLCKRGTPCRVFRPFYSIMRMTGYIGSTRVETANPTDNYNNIAICAHLCFFKKSFISFNIFKSDSVIFV